MASNCARNVLNRSISSAKTLLCRSSSAASKLSGTATTTTTVPRRARPFFSFSRLPVELGCGVSLMPLHSATASALLNSMLSSKVGQWGYLSEGFATPL